MVSQGFPQLVRVSADILRPDPTRTFPQRTPIISQVRMINEAPWLRGATSQDDLGDGEPGGARELADDHLGNQHLGPLAGAAELEHVHPGVLCFDDGGQGTAPRSGVT